MRKAHHERKTGFTLIELLIVIAIIGILSAVVLAAVSRARLKGNDASIQSDMTTIRTQAQLYYDDNASTYGTNSDFESSCTPTDTFFQGETIQEAIAGITKANGNLSVLCNVSANGLTYAAFAELTADLGAYWCVDSTGASKEEASTTEPATLTACP